MRKTKAILAITAATFSPAAFAQTAALEASARRAIDFASKMLFAFAGFLVLYAVVTAFASIATSEMDGKKKAGWALAGGIGVAASNAIVRALFDIGGG